MGWKGRELRFAGYCLETVIALALFPSPLSHVQSPSAERAGPESVM